MSGAVRRTVVSFHAHPDDEALLTGRHPRPAAAEGHRVVLVVATAGEAGLAVRGRTRATSAPRRRRELAASAAALGVCPGRGARLRRLRLGRLGWPRHGGHRSPAASTPSPGCRSRRAAAELARLLVEERADVLTTYDAAGGYGHPDHVQVHRVGRRAAELAGTPLVLEATVDRRLLLRVARPLARLARVLRLPAIPDLSAAYTDRADAHPPRRRPRTTSTPSGPRCAPTPARPVPTTACARWPCSCACRGRWPGGCWAPSGSASPAGSPAARPLDDVLTTLRTTQEAR